MGLKGNATSSLSFGDNGKCIGHLLGNEREGMKVMFRLMNAARIHTGVQAEAVSSAATCTPSLMPGTAYRARISHRC